MIWGQPGGRDYHRSVPVPVPVPVVGLGSRLERYPLPSYPRPSPPPTPHPLPPYPSPYAGRGVGVGVGSAERPYSLPPYPPGGSAARTAYRLPPYPKHGNPTQPYPPAVPNPAGVTSLYHFLNGDFSSSGSDSNSMRFRKCSMVAQIDAGLAQTGLSFVKTAETGMGISPSLMDGRWAPRPPPSPSPIAPGTDVATFFSTFA